MYELFLLKVAKEMSDTVLESLKKMYPRYLKSELGYLRLWFCVPCI